MGGVQFDSKAEAMYYLNVLAMKRDGTIADFELQPTFNLQPAFRKNGVTHRAINYIADFKLIYPDGRVEIIDVKGHETKEFKIKRKLFEYKFKDLELIIVKE